MLESEGGPTLSLSTIVTSVAVSDRTGDTGLSNEPPVGQPS
jgi:hypothetical protein